MLNLDGKISVQMEVADWQAIKDVLCEYRTDLNVGPGDFVWTLANGVEIDMDELINIVGDAIKEPIEA